MAKKKSKKEAREEVGKLLAKAEESYGKDEGLAHDFVRKLRNAAKKVQLALPNMIKRRICKHCYHLLVPGKNCRVRTAKGHVVIYCLDCKKHTRIPY